MLRTVCLFVTLVTLACGSAVDSAEAQSQGGGSAASKAPPKVEPAEFGAPFPGGTFANLNSAAGGAEKIDLASLLGRKPVVLYYWIAGNPRADEVFVELQERVDAVGGAESVALFGVSYPRNDRDLEAIASRVTDLRIRVPVLNDADFALGQRLRVQSVPNVSIVDGEGKLRLTNGASLRQDLEYKMTLATAIERVAGTGGLGTYGFLGSYYPVTELVGQKCPDFKAPLLSTSVEQRWSSMLRSDQLNILIFWSVDCPHCRKSLPEINSWLKQNGEDVNVISAARVTNDTSKFKTKEFCDLNGFVFPTLVDRDLEIANLYRITSTPTILIIRPDGVIDSVMLSGNEDFGATVQAKKKSLL